MIEPDIESQIDKKADKKNLSPIIIHNKAFDYPIEKYTNLRLMLNNIDEVQKKTEKNFYSLYDYYLDAEKIFDSLGIAGLKEKGIDLSYFDYDTSGIFELNILDENLAKHLFPEGFIQFGDTIMKVNANSAIFIKNADYSLVNEVKRTDFGKNNIDNSNIEIVKATKSYPYTMSASYDNGWSLGCHRIIFKKWYRNYSLYVRVGAKISYYTRVYKRKWLFGKKRLVWIKKDRGTLYLNLKWDKIIYCYHYRTMKDDFVDTVVIPLASNISAVNHNTFAVSVSENPTNTSFVPFIDYNSIRVYGFKLEYNSPIKKGTL